MTKVIVYSIILFAVAVVFLVLGIAVYSGNAKLIHDYHQTNVKEDERREYGRAFSIGMFAVFATLLISGIIALFSKEVMAGSFIVLGAGLIVSGAVFVTVQKKYNGGLF